MDLSTLGLSADAKAARRNCLGGSDANTLCSGDRERIHKLWLQKTGQIGDDDLSGILPVQLGSYTEAFNKAWFERQSGWEVTRCGDVVPHPERTYMRCTLDGMVRVGGGQLAVWEAKHCGATVYMPEVLRRYRGQLTHNMLCCGVEVAVLSVIFGNSRYDYRVVELDELFAADLLEAEEQFWAGVVAKEPPYGSHGVPMLSV